MTKAKIQKGVAILVFIFLANITAMADCMDRCDRIYDWGVGAAENKYESTATNCIYGVGGACGACVFSIYGGPLAAGACLLACGISYLICEAAIESAWERYIFDLRTVGQAWADCKDVCERECI